MEDRRKFNGGNKNAGRKPKNDELKLIEKLSPLAESAFNALKTLIEKNDIQAVKLFMEYTYGKPKQIVESDNTHRLETFDLREVLKFKQDDSTT